MTTKTDTLYINNNGRITCIDHGGSYLSSEYRNAPERRAYQTPLDTWERIDVLYAREWVALCGTPPKCETCR